MGLIETGIDTPGLFRVPGKHSEIMSATTAIDDGQEITFNYLTRLYIMRSFECELNREL